MSKKENVKQVKIHEFPLHEMKLKSKIVIIGKPATGKSTVTRDIIKAFKTCFSSSKNFFGNRRK